MIRKAKLLSLYCEYRLIYVSGHIFHGDASFTGSMKVALHFHCTRKKLNSRRILMYLRGLRLYVNFFFIVNLSPVTMAISLGAVELETVISCKHGTKKIK